uniref:Uncharacterized protein n=1 Tax=Panagrolaimus sp. ES5 TaxID=591445 RepID=A0AC34FIZ3_9BILA
MYAAGLLSSKVTISSFNNIAQKRSYCYYEDYIIVSERTFNLLPYAYQSALVKLSKLLTKATNLETQRELFESFSKKFTLHVEILKLWKELETQAIHPDDIPALEERETYINIKASQHLYDDKFLNYSFSKPYQFPVLNKVLTGYTFDGTFESDVYNFLEVNEGIKISLTFPNQHLHAFWKYYLKHSLSPIHPTLEFQYRQAIIMYEKISRVIHNKRQWIRFMKETNDHEFVVQNVEAALGKNPFNKDMWKEYIEYLRKIDPKGMLDVYLRCCHFFVDDWEIRESYLKNINKLEKKYEQNVEKWKADYANLKADFPVRVPRELVMDHVMSSIRETTINPVKKYLSKKRKSKISKQIPALLNEDDEENEIQAPRNPAFKLPLIDYITKNANSHIILKLYSISKWFYFRSKVALCHRFSVTDTDKTISFESSFFVSPNDLIQHRGLRNIYITNAVITRSADPFSLSKVLPIIYKSDPIYIDIKDQTITFEDYCLLVSGGNVADICFDGVTVLRNNGNPVTVDYLIEKLPKVKSLKFGRGTVIDRFSSGRLGDIKLKSIVEHFEIHELDESFEVFGFSDFVRNNTTTSTHFYLHFKDGTDATIKSSFRCNLFYLTESWIPRFTTPYLYIP